jgi:hypothetical protein
LHDLTLFGSAFWLQLLDAGLLLSFKTGPSHVRATTLADPVKLHSSLFWTRAYDAITTTEAFVGNKAKMTKNSVNASCSKLD